MCSVPLSGLPAAGSRSSAPHREGFLAPVREEVNGFSSKSTFILSYHDMVPSPWKLQCISSPDAESTEGGAAHHV